MTPPPEIDWPAAHARLEAARRRLTGEAAAGPEEVARLLQARARALAQAPAEPTTPDEMLDLVVFVLAGERFGIEAEHVLEVLSLREPTPVPGTPPTVLGVVNHRGRILPVLDLRPLLDLEAPALADGSPVVAVTARGMRFGLAADAVVGIAHVGPGEVAPAPAVVTREGQALLRGVTRDLLAVLDLDALARDRRIVIDEHVG